MLSTQKASKSSSSNKPVKTLTTSVIRTESKTPETESILELKQEEAVVNKRSTPKKKVKSSPSRGVRQSPLSKRALKVKKALNEKKDVTAVLLMENGTSKEIIYNGSSSQVNNILGGRPTIIGELEDIQVIIIRSLNQSQGELNKNILPVPFCNMSFKGPFLLYKVDKNGNPSDLSLLSYEKFKETNKTLTESARKNYNPIDDKAIKVQSSFNSNSKLTLVYLRSEVDKKIRSEFEKKTGKKPKESEIEEQVNEALQKLVDELVSESSPMNDPDYSPSDDQDMKFSDSTQNVITSIKKVYKEETGQDLDNRRLLNIISNTKTELLTLTDPSVEAITRENKLDDERDWRLQLNDALDYVRQRGRLDGRILAEKISETFYELNGQEPSLDQLVDVFRRIRNELSLEAEEDLLESQQQRGLSSSDNGTAYALAKKLDFANADPSDLVEYAFRIVREDLVSRAKSSFVISKGRNPSKQELRNTVEKLASKLADQAVENSELVGRTLTAMREQTAEDALDEDYDPDNMVDRKLAKQDALETQQFDEDFFNLRMLTTPSVKSRLGKSERYDVYFCKFSQKRKARNLERAIATFKLRNKREPNLLEINHIKEFISTKDKTNLIQFKLSIVSDSDNEEDLNEEKSELLKGNNGGLVTNKGPTTPSKVLVTPVKKKKSAARYNVYFDDKQKNSSKNEKMAIKWFKRFNNREPTELELGGIKQFIAADKSQLTECEYEVPVSFVNKNKLSKDMDDHENDDRKETEEDDLTFLKKMKQDSVVKKDKSTKYTLNFDDEQERENGDEKQALKWFKRFNNRNPTTTEVEKIKAFVKADNDHTVDID